MPSRSSKVTVATSVFQSAGKTGSAVSFGLGGLALAFAATLTHIDWPLHGPASAWQITFALVGLPGLALAFLAFSFPEPGRKRAAGAEPARGEVRAFLRRHGVLCGLIAFAFTCLAMVGYSLTAWVPSYMDRHFGWQPARYGVALSMMNILGALALIVCGRTRRLAVLARDQGCASAVLRLDDRRRCRRRSSMPSSRPIPMSSSPAMR